MQHGFDGKSEYHKYHNEIYQKGIVYISKKVALKWLNGSHNISEYLNVIHSYSI